MTCRVCSQPVPEGARFCPSCGAAQTPVADAGDEERRVVTVVFADLVGFTAMSEHRDPERLKRVVDAVFEQLVRNVESFGGVVDKIVGDAVVALFGAPVAHEDDADRAVRAGLAMQATLRVFREDHPDDGLRMRVGVNTGEVLVGKVAGTDYTAMGDVVNTASRLQEQAPVGSVVVSQATRDLCSAAIRFRQLDSVQLRGREQETTLWRVVGVDLATPMRRWPSDVAFVGRAAELDMLGALTSSVLAGRSAIAVISGEAGIGKSRLVNEAIAPFLAARRDTLLLEGACAPYGESNVWWPVAGGLLATMGLDRNAPPTDNRRRLVRRLVDSPDFTEGTPYFDQTVEIVMHLLGQPSELDVLDPAGVRDAVVAGMVEALRRRARRAPVIMWVDDIQWAAAVLLDLLETVARQLAGLPLLIVATVRPEDSGAVAWPPPVDPALTLHLSLDALDPTEAGALVREAAGHDLPDEVVTTISARSGGNPLFLIELARLAASDGTDGGDLPGTLRALIAARLDSVTPSQRQVLDNAAILGNEGQVVSLRRFAEELGQTFDVLDLDSLEETGLLVRSGSRWRFRSDVVREVAYRTLTKQARAQRHAGVARYLAVYEPNLVDRRAHHSSAAAMLRSELGPIEGVPDDIDEHAILLLAAAASQWADQGAHRRAVRLIDRALSLGVDNDEVMGTLLLQRVESLVELRDMRLARVRAVELSEYAAETGDRVLAGEAARLRGTIEQADGDLVRAREHLAAAVDDFRDIGNPRLLAEALLARGLAEVFGGSLSNADRFLAEAETLFTDIGEVRGLGWVHQHRAWVSLLAGDHAETDRRLSMAIESFDAVNDRAGRAWSMGLLGYSYHFRRQDDRAVELANEVLADAQRWGDDWGCSMMLNLLASIGLWRGEIEEARSFAARSLAGFRGIDDRFGVLQALSTLMRAQVALGQAADADRSTEEALALSGSFGAMAYPLLAAAGAAMHAGDGRRAADLAGQAVARLDTKGVNVDEARVVAAMGSVLAGDPEAALAELLDVDVETSPFALAVRATTAAVIGDRERAVADVRAVEQMGEGSYWDVALAQIVGAAMAGADEADARREALVRLVDDLDDVVLVTFAATVLQRLHGEGSIDAHRVAAIGGWADLADALVP